MGKVSTEKSTFTVTVARMVVQTVEIDIEEINAEEALAEARALAITGDLKDIITKQGSLWEDYETPTYGVGFSPESATEVI